MGESRNQAMGSRDPGSVLGLIGGLGPAAGIFYYQELQKAHAARQRVLKLLMSHADLPTVLKAVADNDLTHLADYLAGLIGGLARAGARVAAVAAVTPHICAHELARQLDIPLVDIVDETAQAIRRRGLKRVALFGTRFTMETRLFGRLEDVTVVRPSPAEVARIHDIYLEIVGRGQGSAANLHDLSEIGRVLCERDGAEAILLAGTELSLALDEARAGFPVIDCARLHIEGIMRALVEPSG
jgi:aspartate racemase